jgi:ATP-dependent DNA ligase
LVKLTRRRPPAGPGWIHEIKHDAKLPIRSCLIDGEAIVCDANGLAVFDLLRRQWHGDDVILCAFDLLELDGRDMRRLPNRGAQGRTGEAAAPADRRRRLQ